MYKNSQPFAEGFPLVIGQVFEEAENQYRNHSGPSFTLIPEFEQSPIISTRECFVVGELALPSLIKKLKTNLVYTGTDILCTAIEKLANTPNTQSGARIESLFNTADQKYNEVFTKGPSITIDTIMVSTYDVIAMGHIILKVGVSSVGAKNFYGTSLKKVEKFSFYLYK